MAYPYLNKPLEDDITAFLDDIEMQYFCGVLTKEAYYVSVGKVLAYIECRFSSGLLDQETTTCLIDRVEGDYLC